MRYLRKRLQFAPVKATRSAELWSLLLVLSGAACGGNTVSAKPEPKPATAPAPKPEPQPTAGTGTREPSPGEAGAAAALPDPICNGPQPVCLKDCTSLERAVAECVADEQYLCPDGWVELDSCSKEACARRSLSCCSPTGHSEYPECAVDGTIGACPAGFEQRSPCVPAGLGLESCDDIKDGSDCASEALICIKSRCGRNCLCEVDLAGKLLWRCRVNAC